MMRFLVSRPIAVTMCFVLSTILSLVATNRIPVSLFPDSEIPKMEVLIKNPGVSPENFEQEVVQKMRNNLLRLNKLLDINSTANSVEGRIELLFDYATDMNLIFFEVNEIIDESLSDINIKLDRPKVLRFNLSEIPSLYLAVSMEKDPPISYHELSSFVESKLKNRLEQTEEISFVDISGLTRKSIEIEVDQGMLHALGLTLNDLQQVIESANFNIGEIIVSKGEFAFKLSLENSIGSVEELNRTYLRVKGKSFTLSEIAKLRCNDLIRDEYYFNGEKAISLALLKNPNYREQDLVEKVDAIVSEIAANHPYLKINKTKDQTVLLKETLASLGSSLIVGLFLAIVITYILLRSKKNILLIASGVVISLFFNVLLFYLCGISINLVSISGLIIGVGLMIDNIIIVLDNIEQHVLQKRDVKEGAISGTTEIISALISSALTTASIFIPLLFLSGLVGILFYDQAIAVSISLFSSFVVSIILLPTLYVLIHKRDFIPVGHNVLYPFYQKMEYWLGQRIKTVMGILIAVLLLGTITYGFMEKKQLPTLKDSELSFKIEWNENLINSELLARALKILAPLEEDIITSELYLNSQSFISKTKRNQIDQFESLFILNLKENVDKKLLINKLTVQLKKEFTDSHLRLATNENALNYALNSEEYTLKVISYDPEVTPQIIHRQLHSQFPGLVVNMVGMEDHFDLTLKEERLLSYQIDQKELLDFIKLKLGRNEVLNLNTGNQKVPVSFETRESDLTTFLNSKFLNESGNQYAIGDLVTIVPAKSKKKIEAEIGGTSNDLYIKTSDPKSIIKATQKLFPNANISFEGPYQLMDKLKNEALYIIILVLLVLYLILAMQFESLKLPLIILFEIPFGIAVSIFTLYLAGQTLNVMSFIGIILMIGIIINDSILKIDLINKLYRSGWPIEKAIQTAGKRRLNAIVITTLTTVFAVIPILFQNDSSTQLQTPLVVALVSGLTFGTLISLFIIPLLYKKII